MLVLAGCVQSAATPATNAATARVLDRLGISLVSIKAAGCCGGIELHMGAQDAAQRAARRNIDAWWPEIAAGAEAIVVTASGCGVTVKDYGHLLQHDPAYADKAARISALARDPVEVLGAEDLSALAHADHGPIAVHAPCTLQHGQRLPGALEGLLTRLGFTLTEVPEAHLCCGSAGTYSLLEPELSGKLLARKLAALEGGEPALIVTANVGCQMHLAGGASRPVMHWIELLDRPG
jgi:glycolate oxidase iron-sulfur subunit